ncbi:hypothetical protein F0562_031963 [Nyssa sinensis]|uniref:SKP1 component POZ domain-containing protein n=1 Tax=Nyssa sinensis TaxID=561372 RepID=A0A5J5AX92_9ASTE|nr:hypothetical protein F0562_031963 [Nyssa sinensis]
MSMLTLKSSDGEEFVVDEFVAIQSITIKNMVEDNCASNTIPIPNIDGKTLAMLIEYCKKHADETITAEDLKQFDSEFVEKDQAILYHLLLAANYLNIQSLLDELCFDCGVSFGFPLLLLDVFLWILLVRDVAFSLVPTQLR